MSDNLAGSILSPAELPGKYDWVLRPMGDRAVLVRLSLPQGAGSFSELSAAVRYNRMLAARTLAARLQSAVLLEEGWPREFVPGYDSVLASFDPDKLPANILYDWLHSQIEQLAHEWQSNGLHETVRAQLHRIPVKYGGERGPDLEAVARRNGLTPDEVVKIHTSATYSVYLIGFAAAFAYLGALPPEINAPRLERPRPQVPTGTVALAAGLTGVYPLVMPGGWNLIGSTSLTMFDASQNPPVRFLPGDRVEFFKDKG